MAIYTKVGDKGETTLIGRAKKIPKDSLEIEILGTIDEVNSLLGLSISFLEEQCLRNKIFQVQRVLFKLGSIIAGANGVIPKSVVAKYEKEIDAWTSLMPPLKNFIFPGGSKASSYLFTARSLVRRAERLIVKLGKEREISPGVFIYVNRLSDYLFTLARYINFRQKIKEVSWIR